MSTDLYARAGVDDVTEFYRTKFVSNAVLNHHYFKPLDRFEAVTVTDRLRLALTRAHPGETPRFTASFGIADSTQAQALEQLLAIADAGLYAAKGGGRDRAHIGDPAAAKSVSKRTPVPERSPAQRRTTPSLHEAAEEEEPRPSGIEIR